VDSQIASRRHTALQGNIAGRLQGEEWQTGLSRLYLCARSHATSTTTIIDSPRPTSNRTPRLNKNLRTSFQAILLAHDEERCGPVCSQLQYLPPDKGHLPSPLWSVTSFVSTRPALATYLGRFCHRTTAIQVIRCHLCGARSINQTKAPDPMQDYDHS